MMGAERGDDLECKENECQANAKSDSWDMATISFACNRVFSEVDNCLCSGISVLSTDQQIQMATYPNDQWRSDLCCITDDFQNAS
jgi:hypothetical protein